MSAADFQAQHDVSRETMERLQAYAQELSRWNARINLVSPSTLPDLWQRHILDSAQIFALAPKQMTSWTDLGTGGGLPGIVIAILARETNPDLQVTCIESDKRKSVFLSTISRQLDLKTRVVTARIEKTDATSAQVLSARALAPLDTLLGYARHHLAPNGIALFPKGAQAQDEIAQAAMNWRFDIEAIPSKTDPQGVILRLGDIQRA
jgi:16S rRNA (guanine527-N7)-methyltransferase